jgi:hypothetical protein
MIIGSVKADDAKTLALLHENLFGENHFIASFSVSMRIKYIDFFQGITELVTM